MKIRVVLVGPEYQLNIGSVARAMANFDQHELYIASPACDPKGFEAVKYAKHAKEILEKAKITGSLSSAIKGADIVVGTSAAIKRHKRTVRNPLTLKQFAKKNPSGKIAILFGREGIGLTSEELDLCDIIVKIETSKKYPTLNLSHSVAIFLHAVSKLESKTLIEEAGSPEKKELLRQFDAITDIYSKNLRNPRKVKACFKRVVGRSLVSKVEASALLSVFKKARYDLAKLMK